MGRLSLDFENVIETLGIERREDGRLYYRDGSVCDVARALSAGDRYESRDLDFSDLPAESSDILDRIKWI